MPLDFTIEIPWSDKLQRVFKAINRQSAGERAKNPHRLVARQLLTLLKLSETPTVSDVVLYTNLKERAAHRYPDAALTLAVVNVAAALQSNDPMSVMRL